MNTSSTPLPLATDNASTSFVTAVAAELARLLKPVLERDARQTVTPALLNVKQAAIYLGRSEQAVQHMIFEKELPVVRKGRRVHLHLRDLDAWIEKNKY